MPLIALDHFHVETTDVAATVDFYRDALGLDLGNRPPSPIKGAWMCLGGRPVVHVTETEKKTKSDSSQPTEKKTKSDSTQVTARESSTSTGSLDHVSFEANDFDAMTLRLDGLGVDYERTDLRPDKPLRQIYLHDPNGVRIELNFATNNPSA